MGHEVDIRTNRQAERSAIGDKRLKNVNDQDTNRPDPGTLPQRDSYDSGYEHSLQHLVALRELVEGAD
jgi:hypothetical protein